MTCNAELMRRFPTRVEAVAYLVSRGFLCLPGGWQNGRWAATLKNAGDAFIVSIWLRFGAAA